ncbi:Hypothetical protein, putative [Bodo saltans]|uniref:Uncharacterized protein n=1 Tax=Bodo saltans TaxID=75058 RepID=A0A0S4JGI0_BODSA|nr:Hypothetical protein, putative [Bodo saltans]|eukprot:CUG90577.1 Hypothetical protein, putative [Bodo saltans]
MKRLQYFYVVTCWHFRSSPVFVCSSRRRGNATNIKDMDVDINPADDFLTSSPHRSQQQPHKQKHLSHRDAPVRLPPVPRRADQLMEKVVSKNLVERHWVSTLTPMDTFTPAVPARRGDFEDPALADPHLQVYWERQRTTAAAAKYKRRKQRDHNVARHGGGNVFNRRITEAQRASTEQSSSSRRQHHNHSQRHHRSADDRRDRSASSSHSSNMSEEDDDGRGSHQSSSSRRCPIPLNEKPLEEGELLCLRNLLCPMGGLQSSITLENIDLRWLRERIEDPNCFLKKVGHGGSPEKEKKPRHKKNENETSSNHTTPAREHGRNKGVPSLPLSTLRNFDVDALANDSFHHTSHISFKTALINSPRSALVILRNGIRLYALLRRPITYYVAASETISDKNLQLRFDLAENERIMVLESLRSQYDQLCGIVPFDRVSAMLCTRQEVDHEAAQQIAHERTQRDLEKLRHHEAREQRFGDLQVEREEAATQRFMALEEKLQQQQEKQKRLLKERGEFLRAKAAAKLSAIAQVREEQEQSIKTTAELMALHRQHKLEAIQDMKQEQAQELHDRAEFNAQRITESRRRILDQDDEEALRMQEYAQHKREKAEAFMMRKEAEHEALRKRAGDADARRHHVKEKAVQEQEALRDKIEAKVDQAAHRFDMFLSEKVEQRKALRIMHHVREIKSRQVLQQAQDAEKAMVAEILATSDAAARKLKLRRHRQAKEQRRAAEAHQFDIAQRQRVVTAKVQQSEFDKLLQLARMQQTEEQLHAYRAVQEEAVVLTREGDKKVQLQRQQSKAMLEARAIDQAKALFQRTVSLKKEAVGASVARLTSVRATSADSSISGGQHQQQERRSSSYFRDVGSRVSSEDTSVNCTPLTPAIPVPRSKSVEPKTTKKQMPSDRSASVMENSSKGRQKQQQKTTDDKKPPRHVPAKGPPQAVKERAPAQKSSKKPTVTVTPPVQTNPLQDDSGMSDTSVVSSTNQIDRIDGAAQKESAAVDENIIATNSIHDDIIPSTHNEGQHEEGESHRARAPSDNASPRRSSISSYPGTSPHHHAPQTAAVLDDDHSSFVESSHGDLAEEYSPAASRPASKASAAASLSAMSFRNGIEANSQGTTDHAEPPQHDDDHQNLTQSNHQTDGIHQTPVIVEFSKRPSSRVSIILDAPPPEVAGENDVSPTIGSRSDASSSAHSNNDRPLHARGSSRQKQDTPPASQSSRNEGDKLRAGGDHLSEHDSSDAPASDYYSDSFASEGNTSNS